MPIMEKMMDKMKPEEKERMMEKMMERFFADMTTEEKQQIMEKMMSKMRGSEGMPMMKMMPEMGEKVGKEDFKPGEMCEKMGKALQEVVKTNKAILEELKSYQGNKVL